jgi:plasmid rolling circle replication initiator protein Rep
LHTEYTTDPAKRQEPIFTKREPLKDIAPSGRVRPWRQRHMESLMLAEIYAAMGEAGTDDAAKYLDKARRLESCAEYAEFVKLPDGQGLRLHQSSFCRVRLCPMCQWRRSLKLGAQVRRVVERANADHIKETGAAWRWLMVTFTIKNVEGVELGRTIDTIHKGLNNLAKCKRWKAAVRGWLRATEVTHNINQKSAAYDTYHPHMHLLLCVPASYFSGKNYIRQKEWAELWGHYIKADYVPVVDVRPIKPEGGGRLSDLPQGEQAAAMGKACAEVSKYAAKPADYIVPSDPALSMQAVQILDAMLDRRRMTSWGGVLKDIAKALQLDDPETGDLVHIDETASPDPVADEIADYIAYNWALGARDYLPVGERRGKSERVERIERAQTKAEVREYRRQQEKAEVLQDAETVAEYLSLYSMSAATLEIAKYNLRTLPRAQIEKELQESLDVPQEIAELWGIDEKT